MITLTLVSLFLIIHVVVVFFYTKNEFVELFNDRKYINVVKGIAVFFIVLPIAPLVIISDSDSSDSLKFFVGIFYSACAWSAIGYLIYISI